MIDAFSGTFVFPSTIEGIDGHLLQDLSPDMAAEVAKGRSLTLRARVPYLRQLHR